MAPPIRHARIQHELHRLEIIANNHDHQEPPRHA
jgi:hypothetical protein